METNSIEAEEVQSRSASVVHRNGQNMWAAQTIAAAAVPGAIASSFGHHMHKWHMRRPPGAEPFRAGPVDIPATAAVENSNVPFMEVLFSTVCSLPFFASLPLIGLGV